MMAVQGYLDSCMDGIVAGWAEAADCTPAQVAFMLDDRLVGSGIADR